MSDTDILSKRRGRYSNRRKICGCCVCPGLFYFLAKIQKYHSPSCNRSKGYAYGTDNHLEQYLDNREFNPELVHELVERVSISNTDGYEITFKCEDVYKRVIEMMEGGECE